MQEMALRALTAGDAEIVQRVLSTTWKPQLPDVDLALREILVYHHGWGRPGDIGVVAERADVELGAAFARLFTERSHGYGFVDDETPELGVAVFDPQDRGSGLGTRLMLALEGEARVHGLLRLSLSVNIPNPALRLYLRLGYTEVDRDEHSIRMIKNL